MIKLEVVNLDSNNTQVAQTHYFNQWGSRSLEMFLNADDVYQVNVQIDWHFAVRDDSDVVRDFNLQVQGPAKVVMSERVLNIGGQDEGLQSDMQEWLAALTNKTQERKGVRVMQTGNNRVSAAFVGANYKIEVSRSS